MNSSSGDEDSVLVRRAQLQGDKIAFSALVNRHQSKLRSFLVRLCKNYDLADDLAQEAFIVAFEKLEMFQSRGSFAAWLFRIAFNCFLQRQRRDKRHQQVLEDYSVIIEVNSSRYEKLSPEQLDLEQALLQLSTDESAAISLCHSYGFSHSEVARILNKPLGTVKSNISRGRKRLKEILFAEVSSEQGKELKSMRSAS